MMIHTLEFLDNRVVKLEQQITDGKGHPILCRERDDRLDLLIAVPAHELHAYDWRQNCQLAGLKSVWIAKADLIPPQAILK